MLRVKVISLNISSEVLSDDCFARNDVENVNSVEYSKESTALEEKFKKYFYIIPYFFHDEKHLMERSRIQ